MGADKARGSRDENWLPDHIEMLFSWPARKGIGHSRSFSGVMGIFKVLTYDAVAMTSEICYLGMVGHLDRERGHPKLPPPLPVIS